MKFKLKSSYIIGISIGLAIVLIGYFTAGAGNLLNFIIGIAVIIGTLPFVIENIRESRVNEENEQMFLEFSRNLVENVRTGTPISKSIMNLKDKDYGTLTRHVKKLANQIMIGISVKDALQIFAEEVDNNVVTRAVGLISEAEKGGGSIEKTLQSVASSTLQIDKIQKERKAVIYNLAVQGYIIFFIFVIIMLILEFKIVGIAASISTDFSTVSAQTAISRPDFSRPFLILLLEQGFFTGLVIGKLSEGNFKSGIKHSFAMVVFALLISTGARAFFG